MIGGKRTALSVCEVFKPHPLPNGDVDGGDLSSPASRVARNWLNRL